jgi:hypothetical protein
MKRHKKGAKGRLLSTEFLPASTGICFTCQTHDMSSMVPASHVRVNTYQFIVTKCYFCNEHIAGAMAAHEARLNA